LLVLVPLETLEKSMWEMTHCDLSAYDDCESAERMARAMAVADYVHTKTVAEFDASGEWALCGAKSAAAWLSTTARMPIKETRRLVRRGRNLRHLPHFDIAWSEGAITGAHIDLVASYRRPATEEALARDEEMLVGHARTLSYREFARVMAYWDLHADPDGAEEGDLERAARRRVSLTQGYRGMFFGQTLLDPISGTIVYDELSRLERELYEADFAQAKEELGRDPHPHELCRSSGQRMADALVEMATRSKSTPANGRRPAPLYTVLVGWETLLGAICELERGHCVLSPRTLLTHIDGADLERAVFTPGGRVEVGITNRFFTGATRRAIEVRDQSCAHPYCDEEASRCQADHIIEWSKGGPTTQENGRLMCPFHNRQRNQRPPPEEPDD
jgi:Domain of unknown function (DUF222)/HNH endonuclease